MVLSRVDVPKQARLLIPVFRQQQVHGVHPVVEGDPRALVQLGAVALLVIQVVILPGRL